LAKKPSTAFSHEAENGTTLFAALNVLEGTVNDREPRRYQPSSAPAIIPRRGR
jgi:hypothetical protein